jgi:hypothetical protein
MAQNYQRLSQLITTFGPGSMVDLPKRSVIVGGLDQWEMASGAFESVVEPRLTAALQRRFQGDADAPPRSISLRTPPMAHETPGRIPPGVGVFIFPTWFVCERVDEQHTKGASVRRRRLVRWDDLEAPRRVQFRFDDGAKSEVTPIRFVAACEKGHIQDIDWRWVVHQNADPKCQHSMWLQEKGTSADPTDTEIVCDCGAKLSLEQLFAPRRLGRCRGEQPWLGTGAREACTNDLRLLTRTATNTYFAQVATVISLPTTEDALTKVVEEHFANLSWVTDSKEVGYARKSNPLVSAALEGYTDEQVFERLNQVRQNVTSDANRPPKYAEYDFFSNGRPAFGENTPKSQFYAQTLERTLWEEPGSGLDLSSIASVVAIHRLREVCCLYGFTRFEAAPTPHDGAFEDISLAVDSAPLSREISWFPAIEQFGEGIFLKFSPVAVERWLRRASVAARKTVLETGYNQWLNRMNQAGVLPFPGPAYVMLHSLSHALMVEIALDCGYPASSLKERVYALESKGDEPPRNGILIYTASTGSQGTLGGLVELAPRIGRIFASALDRIRLCSNDPICSDHSPHLYTDDRALHGAACHGCLFVAETSCEMRNQLLDRSLLVETMGDGMSSFF